MNYNKYVFAQIMEHLPRYDFDSCVERYHGERYAKSFSCRDQFLAMVFGQLAYRESLRDIVTCLSSHRPKMYHLGFLSSVTLPTLAKANERRDWRIYRDLATILINKARKLYVNEPAIASDLAGACYAIDSTSIDLCLSLFPWAPYVKTMAAVKIHMLMDLCGSIPTFFDMTSGKVSDVNFLDLISFESGAFYVMDRGYLDFERLYAIHKAGAFFVTRAKNNMLFERRYSNPVDKTTGILCDQIIFLTGAQTAQKYPDTLRRIKYRDAETKHVYVFLTNNLTTSATSIALLYKHRWQIELFFKWIKQHLKIKAFWGHSENAVKTQICIALCSYLIVAILKKNLQLEQNLYEILQITSASLFDKSSLVELFSDIEIQTTEGGFQKTLPFMGF
ncbi:MAG: IS4 family transposase [Candidatus Kaiserbacteria bacterium]|nr:IS4 family transposase [Candidatus Kaiserbacteria bacterium]